MLKLLSEQAAAKQHLPLP